VNYRNRKNFPGFQRKAVVLAIAMAFNLPALAADEDDEIRRLIKPESTISLGMGHVSGDNQRFGMYNGLNEAGYVGLIDFSVVRRDDETGTWYRALGRNLGLDNREFGLEVERQGSWGASFNYDEITRHSPNSVYTNNRGIDSTRQTIPSTSGNANVAAGSTPYSLKTERHKATFGLNATLMSNLEFRLVFQNEKKEGQRLFGRGTPSVQEFLAEPIDYTTKQFDAVLDYTGESLQLSGGYYGSFFNNNNSALMVNGGNSAFIGGPLDTNARRTGVAMDNIALPPDNHAHQFHLAGGYQFTKSTRMNFKVAKSIAIQDESFIPVNFYHTNNNGRSANTSGRSDLGGRIETTLVNLGVTSRPITNLLLLGNIRYENRDDKTEVARYITSVTGSSGINPTITPYTAAANPTSSTDGYNEPRSLTNKSAKIEASYLLPEGFRLTGGYDIDQKERSVNGVRVVGYREKTDENTFRLEVKRTMAESLTGSFAYLHSDREGSGYNNLVTLNGTNNNPSYATTTSGALRPCGQTIPARELQVTRCGLIQPIYMADRERDKIRLLVDWSPLDQLSTQFAFEGSYDNYGPGRGSPDIGVRQGDASLYSVDLAYTLSDNWKFTGWYSRTGTSIEQSTIANPTAVSPTSPSTLNANSGAVLWSSSQRNTVDSFGLGLRAKLPMNIDIGADYIFANDKTRYGMSREAYAAFTTVAAAANTPGTLPDIKYRQNTVRIFGSYNFDKDTKFRLDYIFDNRRISDWTWSGYQYSDGSRISANAEDTVHFIGASISYAFR
jgi:MtrB/PioB family decaheme-associated outer membrane protein